MEDRSRSIGETKPHARTCPLPYLRTQLTEGRFDVLPIEIRLDIVDGLQSPAMLSPHVAIVLLCSIDNKKPCRVSGA